MDNIEEHVEELQNIVDMDPHHDMHFDSKQAQIFTYIQTLADIMLEILKELDSKDKDET